MNRLLCINCHRDKFAVAAEPGPGRYCVDCAGRRCAEHDLDGRCEERQAVDTLSPLTYLDYCRRHWRERYVCPSWRCGRPKEPWQPLCRTCEARALASEHKLLVRHWRANGTLCPSCKAAPQHAPQALCAPCLQAKGMPVLEPVDGPWLDTLRAAAKRRAGQPASLAHIEARERARNYARIRARETARNAKRLAKFTD